MKLKQFLKAADGRICGGSEYQWDCYGPAAQYMDVSDINGEEIGGCIFDRKTQNVYQVEVYVYSDDVAYRWIDPAYRDAYANEAESRKIDADVAYDTTYFTETDSEDILHLLTEMVHGTYVHSKPIIPMIKGIGPECAWPFPVGTPMSSSDVDEALDGEDADWGYDDEDGFDVDEFRDMACADHTDDEFFEEAGPRKEYEVVLTVKHRFTVKARNMEAAGDKTKEFQQDMKSGNWPDGLCWEDRWVSKVAVSKRLETTNIED